ncbi:MAG: ATP synthase subunit I [Candidatus Tectomicrobia bacterium]|nr:ATP synthase subunit I [Candidatus Tectomicrobia bacterium]
MTKTPGERGRTRLLRTLERHGWIWLGVLVGATLLWGHWEAAARLALGGAISVLNFRWLCFFYQHVLPRRSRRLHLLAGLGYLARYVVIGFLLYLALSKNTVELLALIAGLSLMVFVIPGVGLWTLRHTPHGQFEAR